jgi:class 3 adenylate cyclase
MLGERLDPESLRHVMGRYFEEMRGVIERHGGTVEKFIGDAVMGVFGIPRLHEDDALRAVRAAVEMREALARLNEDLERGWAVRLQIRTGVNTGEVVAGDPSARQTLVTGDPVNVAARLEQSAQPGEILIGQETYRLVENAVLVEPVEPLSVKGKGEPVEALRLLAVLPGAPAHARRLDSPLVGRERERQLLEHAYDRAVGERTCHLFTVLGSVGVGKSRLVAELKGTVANPAPTPWPPPPTSGEGEPTS